MAFQDNLALEQAIVAYSDSLQYLPSDITTISEEVAEGLVASGSGHDKAALLSGRQVELWEDIAKQTGKARQVAFSRALRKELERISAALPLGSVGAGPSTSHRRQRTASDDVTRAELPQSAAPFAAPAAAPAVPAAAEQLADPAVPAVQGPAQLPAVAAVQVAPAAEVVRPAPKNARHYMQLLQPAEGLQGAQGPQGPQDGRDAQPAAGPLDELNLRHIDVQKDDARFANHPWMGVTCRQEWGHDQPCHGQVLDRVGLRICWSSGSWQCKIKSHTQFVYKAILQTSSIGNRSACQTSERIAQQNCALSSVLSLRLGWS